MEETWTNYELAHELLRLIPSLGRLSAIHLRTVGDEETTMMQMSALLHIQDHQSMTTSELARKRHVSLQAASALVQGLVERGWVTRVPDPDDRRQFLLQVTPDGVDHAEITRRQVADYLAEFLGMLTPEEMAAAQVFLPGLQRVVQQKIALDLAEDACGSHEAHARLKANHPDQKPVGPGVFAYPLPSIMV